MDMLVENWNKYTYATIGIYFVFNFFKTEPIGFGREPKVEPYYGQNYEQGYGQGYGQG